MRPVVDLTGNKYGKLKVVERGKRRDQQSAWWLCECECGKNIEVSSRVLRFGDKKDCGCEAKKPTYEKIKAAIKSSGLVPDKDLALFDKNGDIISTNWATVPNMQDSNGVYRKKRQLTTAELGLVEAKRYLSRIS